MQCTFNLNSLLKFTSLKRALTLLAVLCGFVGTQTFAATYTWDAGGTDNFWTTGNNWQAVGANNNTAPNGGDDLVFAGTNGLTNTNNLTGSALTNVSISFASGAGAFFLNGSNNNIMALTNGVTNNSANIQTLNLNIALAAANTWAANSNDIVMNGVVSGGNT